ncbi:MAG: bifunctional tetrahydrofolate synthase/dihydrofolate synthase [Gammaproteobacteria bacterium]|nr:bifunctional tetrahydrofolate synthase/dihydrofolate synthase [Gammaproteobacteria bacterium]
MIVNDQLPQWLSYLETLHLKSIDLSLERISAVAKILGIEAFSCPVITIGGTNGKGSTVALLEAIYRKGGYKVASYISPHLHHFNERIRFNGNEIEDASLVTLFKTIENARGGITLTFFEYTTLAALLFFKQLEPDVILLEVGLGGRFDAVNIIDADVAIIASIDLDHTEWLGETREKIGFEKAGIFREGKIAICGDPDPPQSLVQEALKKKTVFYCQGREFNYVKGGAWEWQSPNLHLSNLPVPELAIQNASTVLMAYSTLAYRLPVSADVLADAMSNTRVPGRFQTIRVAPRVVIDVAHNPAAAAMLSQQLSEKLDAHDKIVAVFGALNDKDAAGMIDKLSKQISEWYIAPLQTPRSYTMDDLFRDVEKGGATNIQKFDTIKLAYENALNSCTSDSCIIIFGSFYTIAELFY